MPPIDYNWSQGPTLASVVAEDGSRGHECFGGHTSLPGPTPQPILGGGRGSHRTALPTHVTSDLSPTLGGSVLSLLYFWQLPCGSAGVP